MRRWLKAVMALFILLAIIPAGFSPAAETPDKRPRPKDKSDTGESGETLLEVSRVFTFIRDPEIIGIVKEIGDLVARAYSAPREKYHFYILNDPENNAFTTPSGDIFLFSGHLTRMRSEDELAAVIAHEMAHKEADHFEQISRKSALIMIPTIAALILSRGEQAVVVSAIAVASAYQLQFSREMEEEADIMAVSALKRTTFDPLGMVGTLEAIEKAEQLMPSNVPDHLSTHPPLETRKAGLESILGRSLSEIRWAPTPGRRWLRFEAILAGITSDRENLMARWREIAGTERPSDSHHLNGLTLLKAGHPQEAVREMLPALEKMPDDGWLLADLGAACFQAGDYAAAAGYLEKAKKALPDSSYPVFYLAEMEREAGRPQQAAALYQRAMDGRPELPEAYYQYGFLIGNKGKEGESAFYMGTAALLNGQFKEAQPLLREAERKLGGNPFWRERIEARLAVFR